MRSRCCLERMPAGTIISVDTTDFEEFCDFAVGWNIDHQLIGRKKPRLELSMVTTPALQLGLVRSSAGYCSQGENPIGTVSIAVPIDDARPMIYSGRRVDQRHMAVCRTGAGFEMINRAGAHHLTAAFSQARLEQYAVDVWHESRLWQHSADRLRFSDLAHRVRYVEACQTVLGDVQRHPRLLADPRTAVLLEEKLLENLLLEGYSGSTHASDRNRYQVARKAYRYLLEHMDEIPSIRTLCAMTGASYMTLERGFRETYGLPPHAHLKALRLSRARRELLHPTPDSTVTGVALHWGFLELGRFSVQYRQRFGETPRETLRKARAKSGLLTARDSNSANA